LSPWNKGTSIHNPLDQIKNQLKKFKDNKIVFFCIGNALKGDDGVGDYLFERLPEGKNIHRINGSNAPVNFIGKIEKLDPKTVIIIDCVHSGQEPGSIHLKESSDIYSSPVDTHSGLLGEYIRELKMDCKWYILGIEPYTLEGINRLSPQMKKRADEVSVMLRELFEQS